MEAAEEADTHLAAGTLTVGTQTVGTPTAARNSATTQAAAAGSLVEEAPARNKAGKLAAAACPCRLAASSTPAAGTAEPEAAA